MSITLNGTTGIIADSPATVKANAFLDAAGGNTATVNGTLIPASGVTLVSTAATQTLTNKSIAASQLTGALPAIDGSALTNLPSSAPTTAQVGTATAALAYNAVGSYGFFMWSYAGQNVPGATVAGSALYPANTYHVSTGVVGFYGGSPSGTWRLMGQTGYYSNNLTLSRADLYVSLFLRIS